MNTPLVIVSSKQAPTSSAYFFRDPIGEYAETAHAPQRLEGELTFLHLRALRAPQGLPGVAPTGLIAGQALTYAAPYPTADLPKLATYLPNGLWFGWLESILRGMGEAMDLDRMILRSTPSIPFLMPVEFEAIDSDPTAALERRRVRWALGGKRAPEPARAAHATELVHLPTDHEARVALVTEHLLQNGFVPVGIRPGSLRPDEIVFQRIADPTAAAREMLERFSGPLVEEWARLIAAR